MNLSAIDIGCVSLLKEISLLQLNFLIRGQFPIRFHSVNAFNEIIGSFCIPFHRSNSLLEKLAKWCHPSQGGYYIEMSGLSMSVDLVSPLRHLNLTSESVREFRIKFRNFISTKS